VHAILRTERCRDHYELRAVATNANCRGARRRLFSNEAIGIWRVPLP